MQYNRLQRRIHPGKPIAPIAFADEGTPSEQEFAAQLKDAGIAFEREYAFAKARKWRFDFAFPGQRVAIEVDGDVHRLRDRFLGDRAKLNQAVMLGWRVLRFGAAEVADGRALSFTLSLLAKVTPYRPPPADPDPIASS